MWHHDDYNSYLRKLLTGFGPGESCEHCLRCVLGCVMVCSLLLFLLFRVCSRWGEVTTCTSDSMLALRNNGMTQGCGRFSTRCFGTAVSAHSRSLRLLCAVRDVSLQMFPPPYLTAAAKIPWCDGLLYLYNQKPKVECDDSIHTCNVHTSSQQDWPFRLLGHLSCLCVWNLQRPLFSFFEWQKYSGNLSLTLEQIQMLTEPQTGYWEAF
ncbi:uncharacterized protein LOC115063394 [Mus pahari]|uniref:uncharacterized protein LOC115063394 n=1 Tax=Mus pahari TaxID=10093 RepID=UPI0011149257|nr:uncharacterized protein LOC115063394 [Mus pahari]